MASCCQLVGNYPLRSPDCYVSINSSGGTEGFFLDNEVMRGPTIGTISVVGFANNAKPHVGCPVRANISNNWIRKYDCEKDKVYFIDAGAGKSYASEGADRYGIRVIHKLETFRSVNASSESGPAVIYQDSLADSGFGLTYSAGPINFNTAAGFTTPGSVLGFTMKEMFLQSFNFEASPGASPRASYSFVFQGMPK